MSVFTIRLVPPGPVTVTVGERVGAAMPCQRGSSSRANPVRGESAVAQLRLTDPCDWEELESGSCTEKARIWAAII